MDLTKIDKPFGELDVDTAGALFVYSRLGGNIQMKNQTSWVNLRGRPMWGEDIIYRAAPESVTPDSIDWSHVADGMNCMMRDGKGRPFLFPEPPVVQSHGVLFGTRWVPADVFASYRRGTCDWRDSLVTRPGLEDAK